MNKAVKIISQFALFVGFSIVIWVATLMVYSEAFDVETITYLERALTFYVSLDMSALLCRMAFRNKEAEEKMINEWKAEIIEDFAKRLKIRQIPGWEDGPLVVEVGDIDDLVKKMKAAYFFSGKGE